MAKVDLTNPDNLVNLEWTDSFGEVINCAEYHKRCQQSDALAEQRRQAVVAGMDRVADAVRTSLPRFLLAAALAGLGYAIATWVAG